MHLKIIALCLVGILALTGCTSKQASKKETTKPKTENLKGVAALVNSEKVMDEEVEHQLSKIEAQHKTEEEKEVFKKQKEEFRKSILEQLINDVLYEQNAEKLDIKVTEAEVEAKYEEAKNQFPDEASFNKALEDAQFTHEEMKEFYRMNLLIEKVNLRIIEDQVVSEEDANTYYEDNKHKFGEFMDKPWNELADNEKARAFGAVWVEDENNRATIKIL